MLYTEDFTMRRYVRFSQIGSQMSKYAVFKHGGYINIVKIMIYFMQSQLMAEKAVLRAELSDTSVVPSSFPSSDNLPGPSGLQSTSSSSSGSQELL